MTAIDGRAVQRGLDLGDAGEDVGGERADVGVELGAREETADLGVVAVVVARRACRGRGRVAWRVS